MAYAWIIDNNNSNDFTEVFQIVQGPETPNEFNIGDGDWQGAFAVGSHVWFINNRTRNTLAYSHSNGTLTRSDSHDFSTNFRSWRGGASIGNRLWILDGSNQPALRAHTYSSGTLTAVASNDVTLGSGSWQSIFTIGETLWAINNAFNTAYAYNHSNGTLTADSSKNLSLGSGTFQSAFTIGDNVWVHLQAGGGTLLQKYSYSNGTFTRDDTNDINYPGTTRGAANIGNSAWTITTNEDVFGFALVNGNLVRAGGNRSLVHTGTTTVLGTNNSWQGGFAIGENAWIVRGGSPSQLRAFTIDEGTITANNSADFDLPAGSFFGAVNIGERVWVFEHNNRTALGYTVNGTTFTRQSGSDFSTPSDSVIRGGTAIGDQIFLVDSRLPYIRAYTHNNGTVTADTSNDIDLIAKNFQGAFSSGDDLWIVNDSDNQAESYRLVNGSLVRRPGQDVKLTQEGLWTGGFATAGFNHLYLGNTNITNALIGNSRISRIFLGETPVYER